MQELASYPLQADAQAIVEHLRSLDNLVSARIAAAAHSKISKVVYDSRHVTTGSAFFCLPGEKTDGNRFIDDALKLGAEAIVSEQPISESTISELSNLIQVKDVRAALGQAADFIYGHPSKKLRLLGITGTNGKTTTTHLIEHIFRVQGERVGLIGTLGARTNLEGTQAYIDIKHTTPQASDLMRLLFQMLNDGVTHVSMEVSSHALALKRVAACNFASIGLTNLTQDHLDFHKTMEDYFCAKRILFAQLNESCQNNRAAIVNKDDSYCARFIEAVEAPVRVLTYGWQKPADLFVEKADFDFSGAHVELNGISGKIKLELKLNGKFNVYNVMAAILLCQNEGISAERCLDSLSSFTGVSGRFERVYSPLTELSCQPLCLVDYAHTPDGLENILRSARALVPKGGKLIVVFGCGGDRDPLKRPQMGEIAEALADQVIVTSDNPRSEDQGTIIEAILMGMKHYSQLAVEPDRAAAIELAIQSASVKDVIVIAGKGHETYQILKDRTIDFDDRLLARAALDKRLSKK